MARPVRYTFILMLVAVSTAMAAVGGWRFARASAPVSGPIILISIDSLRTDRLGAYQGESSAGTPAIDMLARDGVVFERAYSPSPQTLPAHTSLLSGRLPFRTGVRDTVGFALDREERTIAEVLRDRGFDTGGIVSSYALRAETGIDQGFVFFDDELTEDSTAAVGPIARDSSDAQQIAEHWLESAGTDRAFLFLHLDGGHTTHARPVAGETRASAYDNRLRTADDAVGGLVQYLKSHQLYDQSTIILTSDHGEGLGDHGEQGHGLLLYDETVRVPLIIKPAAGEAARRRVPDVVQLVDVMPTIADFARAPLPDDIDGTSLKSLLEEENGRIPSRIAYAESLFGYYHFGWSPAASATDGRYRYIRTSREELYDLQTDPGEQVDLIAELPHEAARLSSALDALTPGISTPPPGGGGERLLHPSAADTRERLEALGYVGLGRRAAEESEAPSTRETDISLLNAYRKGVDLSIVRRWLDAISVLEDALRRDPDSIDLLTRLGATASLADRHDRAAAAYQRAATLDPNDMGALLGAASALLHLGRFGDARYHAELAAASAPEHDLDSRSRAHELLARIALARRDAIAARSHAEIAAGLVPGLPTVDYIEGRLLFDRKRYAEALSHFERALAELSTANARRVTDLHVIAAETFVHLSKVDEAEREFLEELAVTPHHVRARVGLASLYHATGRTADAGSVIDDLLALHPTPDTYRRASRLLTEFGNATQAALVRAEAARLFSPAAERLSAARD